MQKGTGLIAEEIADAILADMTGRKGLGHEWDGFDDEIQAEIREAWILLARRIIERSR